MAENAIGRFRAAATNIMCRAGRVDARAAPQRRDDLVLRDAPSGFQVEYGDSGKLVDDATWTPDRYTATSYWGHVPTDPNDI